MGRKRYTPEQIVRKLREAEVLLSKGMTVTQASRLLMRDLPGTDLGRARAWVSTASGSNSSIPEIDVAGLGSLPASTHLSSVVRPIPCLSAARRPLWHPSPSHHRYATCSNLLQKACRMRRAA